MFFLNVFAYSMYMRDRQEFTITLVTFVTQPLHPQEAASQSVPLGLQTRVYSMDTLYGCIQMYYSR